MGFIQIVDFNISNSYTYFLTQSASGTNDLDIRPPNQTYWYNGYTMRYQQGASGRMPDTSQLPIDSPAFPSHAYAGVDHYLQEVRFHAQFRTSVVVAGGWAQPYPSTGGYMPGYPIALSTAQWHLDGSAENMTNINDPANATLDTTTNRANWNVSLASGDGPSPDSLPGVNGPWTAPGAGGPTYLTWSNNAANDLASFASDATLAGIIPGAAGGHGSGEVSAPAQPSGAELPGGPRTYATWALTLALPAPAAVLIIPPELSALDSPTAPAHRKARAIAL